jgi:hypothetical protein
MESSTDRREFPQAEQALPENEQLLLRLSLADALLRF